MDHATLNAEIARRREKAEKDAQELKQMLRLGIAAYLVAHCKLTPDDAVEMTDALIRRTLGKEAR